MLNRRSLSVTDWQCCLWETQLRSCTASLRDCRPPCCWLCCCCSASCCWGWSWPCSSPSLPCAGTLKTLPSIVLSTPGASFGLGFGSRLPMQGGYAEIRRQQTKPALVAGGQGLRWLMCRSRLCRDFATRPARKPINWPLVWLLWLLTHEFPAARFCSITSYIAFWPLLLAAISKKERWT
jgi:hypothetical protein